MRKLPKRSLAVFLFIMNNAGVCLAVGEHEELAHIDAQVQCLDLAFDAMRDKTYRKIETRRRASDAAAVVCDLTFFDPLIGSALRREIDRVARESDRKAIDRCERDWNLLTRKAIDVFPTLSWGAVSLSGARDVWKTLDERARGIFELAHFEQIISRQITARAAKTGDATEGTHCRENAYIILVLLRAYNLAFYRHHNAAYDILGGRLDERVLLEVWLVLLHADLWPEYQAEGIGLFETLRAQGRAENINLDNLKGRLKRASEGFIKSLERSYSIAPPEERRSGLARE